MGSVKDLKIIKKPETDKEGEGEFIFSDRYSVFDWGEMPDKIYGKGKSLATLSAYFFEVLEKKGIKTHFLGLVENNEKKLFSQIKSPSNQMRVKLLRVLKPVYDEKNKKYDYYIYNKEKKNYLIPLEVIYRNKLLKGASVFKRLKNGEITYKDLGLDHYPKEGETLKKPILDVSTKLEHTDRYIKWDEAQKISGLDDSQMEKIKDLTLEINKIITEETKKVNIDNVDGKFEFGIDSNGEIIVVDVLGTPDECRFLYENFHISKEFARIWYRKTEWFKEIEKAKKEKGKEWKSFVKTSPPKLPEEVKRLISDMYMAVTNEITQKRLFNVDSLSNIIKELKKYE